MQLRVHLRVRMHERVSQSPRGLREGAGSARTVAADAVDAARRAITGSELTGSIMQHHARIKPFPGARPSRLSLA